MFLSSLELFQCLPENIRTCSIDRNNPGLEIPSAKAIRKHFVETGLKVSLWCMGRIPLHCINEPRNWAPWHPHLAYQVGKWVDFLGNLNHLPALKKAFQGEYPHKFE